TRAVAHHDVVGGPDGNLGAVDGVDRVGAREDAGFVLVHAAFEVALAGGLFAVGFHRVLLCGGGDGFNERVFGRDDHEGGTEQRVGSRGENAQRAGSPFEGEVHLAAFGFSDPVALHDLDGLGPVERIKFADQAVGDRKSTRLNSSHVTISYAAVCLKKKSIEQE